jgi:nicotinamidase-related amidase
LAFEKANTALLIVDLQKDYFPGGNMPLQDSLEASSQARRLLEHFRQNDLPVVFVQHLSTRPGATFFIPGTHGVEFHDDVCPLPGETIIQKHFPNSFRGTTLLDHLRSQQIEHLVISGMMTHMCLDATTRAAFDYGFACTVAGDACATRDLTYAGEKIPARQVHLSFLAALNGVYAKVVSAEEILSGKLIA